MDTDPTQSSIEGTNPGAVTEPAPAAETPPRAHEVVEEFSRLDVGEQASLLTRVDDATARTILHEADQGSVARLLRSMEPHAAAAVWRVLPPDDRVGVARHLPRELRERFLSTLPPVEKEATQALLSLPEETAGGRMSPNFVSLPDSATVEQARRIVQNSASAETVFYLYVVDSRGRLVGTLSVRRLITSPPNARIRGLMSENPVSVGVDAPIAEAARLIDQHRFLAVPVVDGTNRISGILTADDARRAVQGDVDRAVFEVTGVDPGREAEISPWKAATLRMPWLLVTVASGLGCAFLAGLFERTLHEAVAIAAFVPLVLALGESVAAQTTAVVQMSLLGRETSRGRWGGLANEVAIGALVGVGTGILVGAIVWFWKGNADLGWILGSSLLLALCTASGIGAAIPLLLRVTKLDPAVASGPVALAFADLATLSIYFGVTRVLRVS
jgi:magnesium transporter